MPESFLNESEYHDLALALVKMAHDAGRAILPHYHSEVAVSHKGDESPVTAADTVAEAIILDALAALRPDIPVIAEESASAGQLPDIENAFFLVDPLDGTREFINQRDEFTVNIALIVNGRPCMGVVYAPALGSLYVTLDRAHSYETRVDPEAVLADPAALPFNEIRVREANMDALTVVASRSHSDEQTEAFLQKYNVADKQPAGSSIKFCKVARGDADLYPRFGRTMEWDTAAGDAVLCAAGGSVTATDGTAFLYGKENEGFANPGFICWGARPASA